MAKSQDWVRLSRLPLPDLRYLGPAIRLPGKAGGPPIQLPKKAPAGLSDAELRSLADALAPILRGRSDGMPPFVAIDTSAPVKLRGKAEQTATERALGDAENKATSAYLDDEKFLNDIMAACENPEDICGFIAALTGHAAVVRKYLAQALDRVVDLERQSAGVKQLVESAVTAATAPLGKQISEAQKEVAPLVRSFVGEAIDAATTPLEKRISEGAVNVAPLVKSFVESAIAETTNPLRMRLAEVETKESNFRYCGIYQRAAAATYKQNNGVTYGGSMFVALKDNPGEIPGPGWQMAVKSGRDGKDAGR